jgi:pimeloyl-ACP methyl ester carboxylesterase
MLPARQSISDAMDRRSRREESIARAESLLPRAKTVWMENSIHDVPLQRPELVADTIREHLLNGFFDR